MSGMYIPPDLYAKKVAVVISSGPTVNTRFALSLAAMVARYPPIRFSFVSAQQSRNNGVAAALASKPDYLLFLDSNLAFPEDALERLIAADKNIVGCNYVTRFPPHSPLAIPLWETMQPTSGVGEVLVIPLGLALVRSRVFAVLKHPWFLKTGKEEPLLGEDYYFCAQAKNAGFDIWVECELSRQIANRADVGFRLGTEGGFEIID